MDYMGHDITYDGQQITAVLPDGKLLKKDMIGLEYFEEVQKEAHKMLEQYYDGNWIRSRRTHRTL